MKLKPTKKLG